MIDLPHSALLSHPCSVLPAPEADFSDYRYREGLRALSDLKDPVDRFFDHVVVMDEHERIRNNRLALLNRIRKLFLDVADISHMRVEQ